MYWVRGDINRGSFAILLVLSSSWDASVPLHPSSSSLAHPRPCGSLHRCEASWPRGTITFHGSKRSRLWGPGKARQGFSSPPQATSPCSQGLSGVKRPCLSSPNLSSLSLSTRPLATKLTADSKSLRFSRPRPAMQSIHPWMLPARTKLREACLSTEHTPRCRRLPNPSPLSSRLGRKSQPRQLLLEVLTVQYTVRQYLPRSASVADAYSAYRSAYQMRPPGTPGRHSVQPRCAQGSFAFHFAATPPPSHCDSTAPSCPSFPSNLDLL